MFVAQGIFGNWNGWLFICCLVIKLILECCINASLGRHARRGINNTQLRDTAILTAEVLKRSRWYHFLHEMLVTALQREFGVPLRCWPYTLLFGKLKTLPGYHHRRYATESTVTGSKNTSRKQITVVSDDGRVNWGQLSLKEKAARTTQQTFNFGVILAGALMTVRRTSTAWTKLKSCREA